MRKIFVSILSILGLAACTSSGPVDNPIGRNLTWFSYVAGDDIRASCRPGSLDRYRFVYNAIWGEQVRTYDFRLNDRDRGGELLARTFSSVELLSGAVFDALGVGQGETQRLTLRAAEFAPLEQALVQSRFFEPPPSGRFLRSDDFYWTVSACEGGQYHFNAWLNKGGRFEHAGFIPALFQVDPLASSPAQPRRMFLPPFENVTTTVNEGSQHFRLQVGKNTIKTPISF